MEVPGKPDTGGVQEAPDQMPEPPEPLDYMEWQLYSEVPPDV